MDRSRVFETPLRLARGTDDGVVVIYGPSGERIALSAGAALRSARDLSRAARVALRHRRRAGTIVRLRFDRLRHLPQRRWQALRRSVQGQALRRLVALMLLPVGIALGTALALAAIYLGFGTDGMRTLGALVLVPGLVLALPLSWWIAPLVMSRDERTTRAPPGSRPHLATSSGIPVS